MPAIRPRADVLRGAARAFEGTVYRARPQQWPYPLDSRGSLLYGARFNPTGLFAPLYASLDPWTACLELLDHTDEQADSILVYELRVRLAAVVDLRNQALLHALSHDPQAPITPAGLMASDLRLAVALAAVVSALGMEGLLVPSAAWDRHVMDPPGLVGTPAMPWGRPPGNAANLVILDSTCLPEPATLPAIYMGHVMLVWP